MNLSNDLVKKVRSLVVGHISILQESRNMGLTQESGTHVKGQLLYGMTKHPLASDELSCFLFLMVPIL